MRMWIDDVRPMPKDFDISAKTYSEAITLLKTKDITFISFDHDLGTKSTGYDIAKYIESMAAFGLIEPIGWSIHSANPAGKHNIALAMQSAERFWKISKKDIKDE